jgi:hypothetical protein
MINFISALLNNFSIKRVLQFSTIPTKKSDHPQDLFTKWCMNPYRARIVEVYSIYPITINGQKNRGSSVILQAFVPHHIRDLTKKERKGKTKIDKSFDLIVRQWCNVAFMDENKWQTTVNNDTGSVHYASYSGSGDAETDTAIAAIKL